MHDLRTLRRLKFTIHKPVKLKTSLALVASALLLASCGGGGSTSTTPTDPTTLTLTSNGRVQNFTPDREYTLSYDTGISLIQVGSMKTDKSVAISITAEQGSQNMSTLSAWHARMQAAKCDVTTLTVADTSYRVHTYYPFTQADGTKMYTVMQRATAVGDGTYNWDRTHMFYVKTAGGMKGTSNCSGVVTAFNIELKPGWNVVHQTFNENPADMSWKNHQYTSGNPLTTVTGNWYAYKSQ